MLLGISEVNSPDSKIWKFPYAFPIIISNLKKTHHTFEIIDIHLHKKSAKELLQDLKKCNSKIYGISAWSHNYFLAKEIIMVIKQKNPDSVVIVGGILSGNSKVLMENTQVDIVVTGAEGEVTLPKVLNALESNHRDQELSTIHGLVFRDQNREIVTTARHKVMTKAQYQDCPLPAYDFFDDQLKELVSNYNQKQDVPVQGFPILTMRGCPFPCTFCGHMHGNRFLRKKWEGFFEEVEFLINRYHIKGIYNFDTNMFLSHQQVDYFCKLYEQRNHRFLGAYELRTTFGDKNMFEKLYLHGARVIIFGLESGSQYMLDRMKKGFKLETMKKVIQAALDANLIIHGNFIFGTPGENKKTINETKDFILWLEEKILVQKIRFLKLGQLNTSGYGKSILIPSPTSELYGICLEEKLIKDEEAYLIKLSDESSKELLDGSDFKIALSKIGGDVNMSEFSSKEVMCHYISYIEFLIQLKVHYKLKCNRFNLTTIILCLKVLRSYARYLFISGIDLVQGKRGFFDHKRAQQYLNNYPHLINKHNYSHNEE